MRRQLKPTAERLLIRPLRDLADTTFLLITNPASVAREYARQDRDHFFRAVAYFVAAFSAAVILNKIASWALGVEQVAEVLYWTFHVLILLSIAALAAFLAFLLGSSPPSLFLKAACLAYGAYLLIGGFLLAGASLTLAGLHEVGYIPDFRHGPTSVESHDQIFLQAYWDCFREESMLFNVLYIAAEARFQNLNYPLDNIYLILTILSIIASLLAAVLVFFGAEYRRWAATTATVLSAGIVIGGFHVGLDAVLTQLYATSTCVEQSTQVAEQEIAEDYARLIAEVEAKQIGRKLGRGEVITSVERQQLSLIIRARFPEHDQGVEGFMKLMDQARQNEISHYCSSDSHQTFLRKNGISFVFIYTYADTDVVEKIVENPDQCRR